jgi:hypothetical protein
MKKMLIAGVLLLQIITACSPYKSITTSTDFPNPYEFTLIDTVTGNRDRIYIRANEWMVRTFNSSKSVIHMQDKEAGKIIGKAVFEVPGKTGLYGDLKGRDYVNYTISIDVKDGRYRCVLSDYYHEAGIYEHAKSFGSFERQSVRVPGVMIDYDKQWLAIKSLVMEQSKALLEDLQKNMDKSEIDDF